MSVIPDGLNEIERQLIAAAAGVDLDLGSVGRGETPWFVGNEVSEVEQSRRTIRAAVLADLLRGERWPVNWRGVRLSGANVVGTLDLSDAQLKWRFAGFNPVRSRGRDGRAPSTPARPAIQHAGSLSGRLRPVE